MGSSSELAPLMGWILSLASSLWHPFCIKPQNRIASFGLLGPVPNILSAIRRRGALGAGQHDALPILWRRDAKPCTAAFTVAGVSIVATVGPMMESDPALLSSFQNDSGVVFT